MVSQPRRRARGAGSRARLRAAAAAEFAARGFAGATVDRIAARARVTKAMVYYHFPSKAALYQEILRDLFASVADRVAAVRDVGGAPAVQLAGFIHAINDTALADPTFPPTWLREIADGGRHVDEGVVSQMTRVVGTLSEILRDGQAAGVFRAVPPLVVQFGIVGPLLLSAATEPIRAKVPALPLQDVSRETITEHVERMALAVLAPDGARPAGTKAHTSRASRTKSRRRS
jgi:AcrR family transcriptional regulator